MAHLEEIIVSVENKGMGEPHDPIRNVTQYWSKDGNLLAENDPLAPIYNRTTAEWSYRAYQKVRKFVDEDITRPYA